LLGRLFGSIFRGMLGIGAALAPFTTLVTALTAASALVAALAAFLEAATASTLATAFVRIVVLGISIAHLIGSNDRLF
jgi:hypothetical protein